MKRSHTLRLKCVSMGDIGVGKSCLIKWFCDKKFVPQYIPTVGVDYGVKQLTMDDHAVHMYFFDMAGGPDYRAVRQGFYNSAHIAILMYDTTNHSSFHHLPDWLSEAKANGSDFGVVIVVANARPGPCQVAPETGRQWASHHGFQFVQVTLPTGDGVDHAFYWALHTVLANQKCCSPALKAHSHKLLLQSSGSG
eukprot:jgi/Ulvmu1/4236/UM191_0009.1